MIDVDNFKLINDTDGHQKGDRVLTEIARTRSSGTVRATDLVARFGGDEFVVMLAHSTATQAIDRLRTLVEHLATIRVGATATSGTITLSVGATEWMVEDEPPEIVSRADSAMYEAKRAGKNRVEVLRRASKSRLFQNGRPVVGGTGQAPATPVEPVDAEPEAAPLSALRRVR